MLNPAARQCSVSLIYRRVFKPLIPNLPPCYMHLFSLKAKAPCPFQLIPAGTLQRNVVSLTQRGGSVVPIRPGRSLGNIVVRGNKYDLSLIGRCGDTIPLHSWILHVGLAGIRHNQLRMHHKRPLQNRSVSQHSPYF